MYDFFTHQNRWKLPFFKLRIFWLCLSTSFFANAQSTKADSTNHKIRFAIGVSSGLHAVIGGDLAVKLLPSWGIRVGYNRLEYSKKGYETSLKRIGVSDSNAAFELDLNTQLNSAQFWLEWMPGSSKLLRIHGGFAYTFDNKIDVTGRYIENYSFNDLVVTPEEAGDLTVRYTSNKILPYFGLGFGHAVPEKLLSLSLEVGAFYRGKPKIDIIGTGVFEPNSTNENAAIIQENASKYKLHPVFALRLGIRLNK